jgi:hypothetical protein
LNFIERNSLLGWNGCYPCCPCRPYVSQAALIITVGDVIVKLRYNLAWKEVWVLLLRCDTLVTVWWH